MVARAGRWGARMGEKGKGENKSNLALTSTSTFLTPLLVFLLLFTSLHSTYHFLRSKLHEKKEFYSLLYFRLLEAYLAHSRHPINSY